MLRGEYKFIDGVGNSNTGQADLHSVLLGLTYHFSPAQSVIPIAVDTNEHKPNVDASIPKEISLNSETLFDFDSAKLKYNEFLEKFVEKLTYYSGGKIKVVGYTDSIGSTKYNQHLSELRAQSVAEYLKRMGVSQSRIEVEGRGEDNFKAANDTNFGRAQNRRVEISFNTQSN